MPRALLAGLRDLAIVLGTGFVLGVFGVPILLPRIGERWAELAEMPIMAAAMFLAAGHILRRFPEIRSPGAGFLAFALTVSTEPVLAVVLHSRSLAEFVARRDHVSGAVYLALPAVFALMPRLRLRGIASAGDGRT